MASFGLLEVPPDMGAILVVILTEDFAQMALFSSYDCVVHGDYEDREQKQDRIGAIDHGSD